MIGWYTDNDLSKTVLGSIPGIELQHVSKYRLESRFQKSVFYGILRGCGHAMHIQRDGDPFWYIDNGYFDALYVDSNMRKNMEGKFRVVKNGMHDIYLGEPTKFIPGNRVLVIPPSPYSANFYDTTPEDWVSDIAKILKDSGYEIKIRYKGEITPLEASLLWCDGVVSFNSMTIMKAIEMGKFAIDTHGMLRNLTLLDSHPGYELADMKAFYEPKQFTLEEFRQGKCAWN